MFSSKSGFFAILLAMAGLTTTGCIQMYGCPSATYNFKGKVTDKGGNPINRISVTLGENISSSTESHNEFHSTHCTAVTDPDGTFEIQYNNVPHGEFLLAIDDIDGDENGGEFISDTISVSTADVELKSVINVPDIRLSKKN